jgi:hypothetical protein
MDKELEQYLAGLTAKKLKTSDNRIVAANERANLLRQDPIKWQQLCEKNKRIAVIGAQAAADAKRGKPTSEEAKQKQKETIAKKGYIPAWNKGLELSDEHKKNLSIANTGKKLSDETKEKISKKSHKSKPIMTPEGPFDSRTLAAKHYFNNKLTKHSSYQSVGVWMHTMLNRKNSGFYFILK